MALVRKHCLCAAAAKSNIKQTQGYKTVLLHRWINEAIGFFDVKEGNDT